MLTVIKSFQFCKRRLRSVGWVPIFKVKWLMGIVFKLSDPMNFEKSTVTFMELTLYF